MLFVLRFSIIDLTSYLVKQIYSLYWGQAIDINRAQLVQDVLVPLHEEQVFVGWFCFVFCEVLAGGFFLEGGLQFFEDFF